MPKVLVVTKDRAEFQLYHPVVELLRTRGVEAVIVAEGLSMDLWTAAGYELYGGLPKAGDLDPNTKIRMDLDPHEALVKVQPNLVMTGLADPIHLGQTFGLEANRHGLMLGFVEDIWRAHRRSRAHPNFICTLDEHGQQAIREWVDYYEFKPEVRITGSPMLDALHKVQPDSETDAAVKASGAERVILIGGQDESTTPMLRGLADLARIWAGRSRRVLFIPRLHPKWLIDPSKAAFKAEWLELIKQIGRHGQVLGTDSVTNTQSLILSATEVVSIYSNLLLETVALGRVAISWNSSVGRERMRASIGVERFPLCTLGAAREVWSASDYLKVEVPLRGSDNYNRLIAKGQEIVHSDSKSAERVAEVIMAYLT